ncbi:MAG: hypothetical protein JW934_01740 [Anaerolineae bacterium]|nr:hypothetical protein [Anaerolineae bacterium]
MRLRWSIICVIWLPRLPGGRWRHRSICAASRTSTGWRRFCKRRKLASMT